jgi:hypothetical protein
MEGGVDRQRQRTALQPSNPALGLRSELFPRKVCGYIIDNSNLLGLCWRRDHVHLVHSTHRARNLMSLVRVRWFRSGPSGSQVSQMLKIYRVLPCCP